MGFLDGLMGNATEVNVGNIEEEYRQLLSEGEHIEKAYKLVRDLFLFTNKRLILIDKQGVTGKKIEYHTIPYRSITHFSVESAGHFDLDAELKIWISGAQAPIGKQFKKDKSVYDIQRMLATYVMKY
ncbi:PH domain-containing protein [Anaeromicrobium sediminis]|uniref:Cytoplasmic protein n=1 Tax=Anaeromicrobium sediminis TaxID=1478221 RepID=A0A267MHI1_9FIRM|nr:PH domain-containing protein [Anaeromicrobium sediminis]PAB59034.1 cytoplasmic protein [Anaeromicrobium sediminis]